MAHSIRGRVRRVALPLVAAAWLLLAAPMRAQVHEAALQPDGQYENYIGHGVDISGNTIAVGTSGLSSNGSVQVFVHDGLTWNEQAELPAAIGMTARQLGWALALDGDVLLAGAYATSDGTYQDPGFQRGAAYVYRRTGTLWTEEAFLQPTSVAAHDYFGRAVALDGDLAVVGAPYADAPGENSGRVWVFRHSGNSWAEEASLVPPDGADGDQFGVAVAVSGSTLVVGAAFADGGAARSGAAYVYTFDGSTWLLQQKITAADASEERFGAAVALDGDALAVGAPRRSLPGRPNAGSVAVLLRTAGIWSVEDWLVADDAHAVANLGESVALQGNVLLAGSPWDDQGAPKTGANYLFRRTAGTWAQAAKLVSPGAQTRDGFGLAAALDGDRAALLAHWRDSDLGLGANGVVDVWSGVLGGGP